jgi:hypothetical protein
MSEATNGVADKDEPKPNIYGRILNNNLVNCVKKRGTLNDYLTYQSLSKLKKDLEEYRDLMDKAAPIDISEYTSKIVSGLKETLAERILKMCRCLDDILDNHELEDLLKVVLRITPLPEVLLYVLAKCHDDEGSFKIASGASSFIGWIMRNNLSDYDTITQILMLTSPAVRLYGANKEEYKENMNRLRSLITPDLRQWMISMANEAYEAINEETKRLLSLQLHPDSKETLIEVVQSSLKDVNQTGGLHGLYKILTKLDDLYSVENSLDYNEMLQENEKRDKDDNKDEDEDEDEWESEY